MIKKEGMKFVLYSKDGKKVLGRFDSEEAAMKHEKRVMAFKSQKEGDAGLAMVVGKGEFIVEAGGRLTVVDLVEMGHMSQMTDDDLRAMRKKFVAARIAKHMAHCELPGHKQYASPEGQQLFADIQYYNELIRHCEAEMMARCMMLDDEEGADGEGAGGSDHENRDE